MAIWLIMSFLWLYKLISLDKWRQWVIFFFLFFFFQMETVGYYD